MYFTADENFAFFHAQWRIDDIIMWIQKCHSRRKNNQWMCVYRYCVSDEEEKKKNAELLLKKTKEQLAKKEEQYTQYVEVSW